MIRLSIPVRQALSKLTLPVLVVLAFGLMLIGKADAILGERARMSLDDLLAPMYAALSGPMNRLHQDIDSAQGVFALSQENQRLREANLRLQKWRDVALSLAAENQTLKANLHWIPDPAISYVTARVATDTGGVYARSVLLAVGPNHSVRKGEIAVDDSGLVGRVTEVGERSARVLLITDMNSRIPVTLEGSRTHAIMMGTNGPRPHLMFWDEASPPKEGERVVTSAEANVFPGNLPVGIVHYTAKKVPEVIPAAHLERLEIVRLFDYGLHGVETPEAGVRSAPDATRPERRARLGPALAAGPAKP